MAEVQRLQKVSDQGIQELRTSASTSAKDISQLNSSSSTTADTLKNLTNEVGLLRIISSQNTQLAESTRINNQAVSLMAEMKTDKETIAALRSENEKLKADQELAGHSHEESISALRTENKKLKADQEESVLALRSELKSSQEASGATITTLMSTLEALKLGFVPFKESKEVIKEGSKE
jgi:hypothetical protein